VLSDVFIHRYGSGDGDIQALYPAELRNLYRPDIRKRSGNKADAVFFMAEHERAFWGQLHLVKIFVCRWFHDEEGVAGLDELLMTLVEAVVEMGGNPLE